ncbi:right-handed parallel beta-helix repeat-containing protein [Solwaraspora sp. WMMD1047]|uniref:right-handed parallel beta-helix repeat-containing protein n=1 Tax=Solwaraspora sp. WMMD1047 TaxID=3016102 RepID=UPI002415992D|nr:right-handed parallel beta-helix repeat-containing protein [Solwaraspora sp. WMMD1047]MDG4832370.1 right-handed parallel beta-helix repeat-containing protein [Solwaraspora sp. WMMD1047]
MEPLVCDALEYGLVGDGVTNDQPALAELVDRLGAACAEDGRRRTIRCPPGCYAIKDVGTVWRSGVSLVGAGPGATRFLLSNPGDPDSPTPLAYFTAKEHGASRDHHIADCTFAGFEIDGSAVRLAGYDPLAKGLGLQYVLRGRFRDLYIHGTAATGFGCDFLQDSIVEGVLTVGCGRLDNGHEWGGAGIGIGVGGWGASERTTITGCTAVGNGTNGIFLELQHPNWRPPRGIRVVSCHAEGNHFGISDWGADGLIVAACTMIGNLEAGFDVSARGTVGIAGRGGLLTGCVVDGNVRDGLSIGNTPGPYAVRGNRISGNGRYGFRVHNLGGAAGPSARALVLDGNEIWGNGLDGVHLDAAVVDASMVNNRIRDNGRRCEPAGFGGGAGVRYGRTCLVDPAARWVPDGLLGTTVTVGDRTAVVVGNSETELTLAPVRPGVTTAWTGEPPADGTGYRLSGAPAERAGITLAAPTHGLTIRDNRIWDGQDQPTQTHGIWLTGTGSCVSGTVEGNDLAGNAVAATRFDTAPAGGRWLRNHTLVDRPPT